MISWQNASVTMTYGGSHNNGDGTENIVWRSSQPLAMLSPPLFARLSVTQL
ncbi:MAG: hypothetical protein ACR2OZ_11285 [Verrucomicrobiales bacterium]